VRDEVAPGGEVGAGPPQQTKGEPEVLAGKPEVLGCLAVLKLNDDLERTCLDS